MKTVTNILSICVWLGCIACSDAPFNNSVRVSPIPATAKIIFHKDNLIYAMDEDGKNVTQITFDNSHHLEHVAVSYDRTKIAVNYFTDPSIGGTTSKLLLFDLTKGTLTPLLPEFNMAGNGGVDWDNAGNLYFAAVSQLPFKNPTTVEEFKANAGANDVYRVKYDGSDLRNITNTINHGEGDVSVSPDSQFISYMATNITDPQNSFTEIWKRDIAGGNPQLLYIGGKAKISSVHDPEISPDGNYVVFSQVNSGVPPVFPNDPNANTAHDILWVNIHNSSDVFVVTKPGPISIIPDWRGNKILFLEITDKTTPPHSGIATINPDGTGYQLINGSANIGKWIPD